MYDQGWSNFQLGQAAAIAWTMFLIIVVIVVINASIAAAVAATRWERHGHHAAPPTARRRPSDHRDAAPAGAGRPARSWLVYLILALVVLVSVFPLYWTVVVASRTNAEISQVPPPLAARRQPRSTTSGGARPGRHRQGAGQLDHRVGLRHRSARCSSARWPASPSPSCASAAAGCCSDWRSAR